MLQVGKKAPAFTAIDENGKQVNLKDFLGKKVLLYFYPRDNTPGCTKEACAFRDDFSQYNKAKTVILGVSPDSTDSHQKFKNKYDLPFTLLSDPENELSSKYGAYGEKSMYGKKYMGIIRSTVLIDEQGKIEKVFDKVKVNGHSQEVLKLIK